VGNVYYEEEIPEPACYERLEDYGMANRTEFLDDLELERRLANMSDRDLLEFTARQTYDVCNLAGSNERRIISLEKKGNKFMGSIGIVGAFIGAVIVSVINFFVSK